ncbi:Maltose/maltodextrin-binding protein precursor [Planctomycetes bacterium MalM25]|nr:Maltose/maltodextrin-binding protein precursor [Planctomycetes bacterium MalM25]
MKPLVAVAMLCLLTASCGGPSTAAQDERTEVVFWHFWGGRDLPVVEDVIRRFNASQDKYRVRGVAMPGANLDLKLFLAIAGGDPPDVMNHDDQVVADWAHRGALTPLDAFARPDEIERLEEWLYPAARRLGSYEGRMYALVNGLDVRALYYNKTALREAGLDAIAERGPQTLEELDQIAQTLSPPGGEALRRVGYLPDPRRLWAWGVVFGGGFGDPKASEPADRVACDSPGVLAALRWMSGYAERYGPDRLAAFRSGDQALTGASFPLVADRRYVALMDGQWRVRDLAEAAEAAEQDGRSIDEYGVCPLPPPPGGLAEAGWANGNYFIVPRGAKQPEGAWEFMKFWSGFDGAEADAAATAAAGGWIPASERVVHEPAFEGFLERRPLFRRFVELAASPNQRPTPALPVASTYYREVVAAAQDVLYRGADPEERLSQAAERTRARLQEALVD